MLDLRPLSRPQVLMAAAALVGAMTGAAGWSIFGADSDAATRIADAQERLSAARLTLPAPASASVLLPALTARPLLALTTGPGAMQEVAIGLVGLVRSSRRAAALVSLNGGPPQWIEKGGSVQGVTLVEVQDARILVETAFGQKEAALGAAPPAPAAPAGASGDQARGQSPPPPGRGP